MPATAATVVRELVRQHFAIVSTTSPAGAPDSAGISFAATREAGELVLYFMTRRHLRKARNIDLCGRVSLVVPLPRRVLWFVPPATLQLHGTATLLHWTDPRGTEVFQRFWLGRRILSGYRAAFAGGERRICFVRVVVDRDVRGYMVGSSLWTVSRDMKHGAVRVRLGA